jgi:hypothetical protein
MSDIVYLDTVAAQGAEKARNLATPTLAKVKAAIGFV